MGVYEILLMVGVFGLGAMALLGFVHSGHGHGADAAHGHGAHVGHAHGGHEACGHAGHGHGGAHGAGHGTDGAAHGGHDGHGAHNGGHHVHYELTGEHPAHLDWMAVLSPLGLFSMALGAGATGSVLRSLGLPAVAVALAAVAGAVLFRVGVVRPLWNLIFAFASRPAGTLEGTLLEEAEAVTAFNQRGEGLVRLVVDGQSIDVLARLEAPEGGARVLRGQRVRVESVDSRHNSVTVSRL